MRVISGKHRRVLLRGFDTEGIRPTMDKVKESVFAMISDKITDSVCLDLFCGTGSLGIEALSNGASFVYFVDQMKKAINITKENLDKVKDTNYTLICDNYISELKKFSNSNKTFDIIFIDPPYGKIKIKKVIEEISNLNILNENGILVCEYEDEKLDDIYKDLNLIKDRKYGKTYIKIYKRG